MKNRIKPNLNRVGPGAPNLISIILRDFERTRPRVLGVLAVALSSDHDVVATDGVGRVGDDASRSDPHLGPTRSACRKYYRTMDNLKSERQC